MEAKIGGRYYTIYYYYGDYHVGWTRVYNSVYWAENEDDARKEFRENYPRATIKYIQS